MSKHGTFLSVFHDVMAIHEPTMHDVLSEYRQNPKSRDDRDQANDDDEYWPSAGTLLECSPVSGIPVIPIQGMMIKRSRWWCCGSDHWSEVLENLSERLDVRYIVLDIDSGGGQVAGTERLGDAVWKCRQAGQTVIAVCNEFCASAALWVASQADKIVMPATGSIGSLGVYRLHFDDTKFFSEQMGIEKSVIYRGKYKAVDERQLDADLRNDQQRHIDSKYSLFVDAVARGRGLASEAVMERWGESQMFSGSEAVSNGLADEIGTLQDVLDSLKAGRTDSVFLNCHPANLEVDQMKANAQGQLLDAAGKVVGSVAELGFDATAVSQHFSKQVSELTDAAVKVAQINAEETIKTKLAEAEAASCARLDALVAAVGAEKAVAAFKKNESVEAAKAGLADELAATLKEREKELAELKARETGVPGFAASDRGGKSDGKPKEDEKISEKDAPFAADWAADKDGCQADFGTLEVYAAYCRGKSHTR